MAKKPDIMTFVARVADLAKQAETQADKFAAKALLYELGPQARLIIRNHIGEFSSIDPERKR